ncbi:alpha/beta fold hydrolase [Sulfoacidibacillus ferrooxidans]|uniref:2-succinyl-6-hydroxy-2, 4-cyclohexadiene-1-carboxylate synthase n=1 Tax=Sulfoacidibacillus ferrooxidans TaxID=2005001 RepID=A0A9X1VAL1_9BACL|nr:alpha/beta hydrolase [Sulfoacidibacillus ferrooxidans]MCI0184726.1 2-succinyl-6-hydroxy-2,4-cyclohexadiene-1-carboxylate synthase [Sulfoacidibacillus ferrooxidans]
MRHLISIGERKLETEIRGTGEKTVVVLPGMNSSIDDWNEVIRELSDMCKVICFHRAGCGESEPNSFGASVIQTVRDVRSLIDALQIDTPIILAGHSYGGLCVQRFAREYPDSVSGVALIDSTSVDLNRLDSLPIPTLNEQQSDDDWIAECKRYASMTPTEIFECNPYIFDHNQSQLSEDTRERISRFYTNPTLYKTMLQEVEVWYQCAKETKESGHFPDVSLKVIARDSKYCVQILMNDGIPRDEAELFEQTWHDLILKQSDLSGQSQFITAINSTHFVYKDRPDIIIQAITELIRIC